MNRLIFADYETTGLDENKDHVLELALVAVNLPTFEVVAQADWLIVPPMWPTVKRNMHIRAVEMHTKTGLLADVDAKHEVGPSDYRAAQIEIQAMRFVNEHAPKTLDWHTPLAGAGPDFDRKFMRKQMPKLHGLFMYRNYDVRSLTQLQEWVFGVKQEESPHRALPDCLKAIDDVRKFLGLA